MRETDLHYLTMSQNWPAIGFADKYDTVEFCALLTVTKTNMQTNKAGGRSITNIIFDNILSMHLFQYIKYMPKAVKPMSKLTR